MKPSDWNTYRTRFLVKAKQLSSSLTFTDPLGRQHCGRKGDYLVESFDGVISIAPRQIFEDIYVPMSLPDGSLADGSIIAEQRIGDLPRTESTTTKVYDDDQLVHETQMRDRRLSQRRFTDTGVNETRVNHARVKHAHVNQAYIGPRNFQPLEVKEVKLSKPPLGRQGLDPNQRHDEAVRANRKLPQPVRERRTSTSSGLRLM